MWNYSAARNINGLKTNQLKPVSVVNYVSGYLLLLLLLFSSSSFLKKEKRKRRRRRFFALIHL